MSKINLSRVSFYFTETDPDASYEVSYFANPLKKGWWIAEVYKDTVRICSWQTSKQVNKTNARIIVLDSLKRQVKK